MSNGNLKEKNKVDRDEKGSPKTVFEPSLRVGELSLLLRNERSHSFLLVFLLWGDECYGKMTLFLEIFR